MPLISMMWFVTSVDDTQLCDFPKPSVAYTVTLLQTQWIIMKNCFHSKSGQRDGLLTGQGNSEQTALLQAKWLTETALTKQMPIGPSPYLDKMMVLEELENEESEEDMYIGLYLRKELQKSTEYKEEKGGIMTAVPWGRFQNGTCAAGSGILHRMEGAGGQAQHIPCQTGTICMLLHSHPSCVSWPSCQTSTSKWEQAAKPSRIGPIVSAYHQARTCNAQARQCAWQCKASPYVGRWQRACGTVHRQPLPAQGCVWRAFPTAALPDSQ